MPATDFNLVGRAMCQSRGAKGLEPRPKAMPNCVPADPAKPLKIRLEKGTIWNERGDPAKFCYQRFIAVFSEPSKFETGTG